jgi:hypothetical protein
MKKDKIIHILIDSNSAISMIKTHQLLIRQLIKNLIEIKKKLKHSLRNILLIVNKQRVLI